MNLPRQTGLGRQAFLDGTKDVGMPNPARHGLCPKRVEASHIIERQVKLSSYPLFAGEFGQTPLGLIISQEALLLCDGANHPLKKVFAVYARRSAGCF